MNKQEIERILVAFVALKLIPVPASFPDRPVNFLEMMYGDGFNTAFGNKVVRESFQEWIDDQILYWRKELESFN